MRPAPLAVLFGLGLLLGLVAAQAPQVTQNLTPFAQDGGLLTVYGSGFVQRNLNQFTYTLFTGKTAAGANTPCINGCQFFCHYRSMLVNAAGTITYCEVPYIPDGTLGITGSNYITLAISNTNGVTPSPVTVATVQAVTSSITPSTSNLIPPVTTGLTISGVGFPSPDGLFTQSAALTASSYQLTLTDGTSSAIIPLLPSRDLLAFNGPLAFWSAGGVVPAGANSLVVRYSKTTIELYYLNQVSYAAAAAWVVGAGFSARLDIVQQFGAGAAATYTDTIGPVQIGVVTQNLSPVITSVPIVAPYNPASFLSAADPVLNIAGKNFLQYPAVNSNNFIPSQSAGAQRIRCDTITASATAFSCTLTYRPTQYQNDINNGGAIMSPFPAANIISGILYAGNLYSGGGASPGTAQPVALINSAGLATAAAFKYPLNSASGLPDPSRTPLPEAIVPNDAPVQADAEFLTISSVAGSFPVMDIPIFYQYPTSTGAANQPRNIAPTVTLTGLQAGGPITCTAIFPDQADPSLTALTTPPLPTGPGTAPAANDQCVIVSMTKDQIVVYIGQMLKTPVGTIISAALSSTLNNAATPAVAHAATPIGIVAPAAGVGGDPHFFGFLGEKYEFNGEPGRVYNLLTDDKLQVNAEIGKWHWQGNETIISKLAFRTANDHRVVINAGGNRLSASGFTMTVDGSPIPPSRIEKTYLGSDGWVRWYPLTPEDTFRLPLWERHQGVALIDLVTDDYKFQVLAVEEGRDKNGVWRRQPSRFLDFTATMLKPHLRPHGLFGQTAHLRGNRRSVHSEFSIEGAGSDYQVSDLFGDDFVFNRYSLAKK